MTILQRLARVPLPSGPWQTDLSMDWKGDWRAALCDDFGYIIVDVRTYDGVQVDPHWVIEHGRKLTPYRMRQAKAWVKAVEKAAENWGNG